MLALAYQRGRLEFPISPKEWFPFALDGSGVELLPLTSEISIRAVDLTAIHRDPLDRIIIATALEMDASFASVDGHFSKYPELAERLIRS